jgi:hypothetical protein
MEAEQKLHWEGESSPCSPERPARAGSGPVTGKGEQRENPRFAHSATIMFENYLTGNYYEGRMVNFSRSGMCFEADFAPQVGTEIFIGIEKSPYSTSHDVFRAQVVWIRELPLIDSSYNFGVGVKYG